MNTWIVSGLLFPLVLAGCGKQGRTYRPTTQELRLNLHSEPPTIDPRKATDSVSVSIVDLCFEGLTRIDPSGQIIPAAAEKIDVSWDKKKYTFTLREAKWSDGTPVTAGDFETTWKTILGPAFACEFASDLYVLKNARAAKTGRCLLSEVGVRALDEKTLQVELAHPAPWFLSALASHSFVPAPAHITETFTNWTEDHYVGNGPFMIREWEHRNFIGLEKNPHYWDKKNTRLEKVLLTLCEDETTELTMFENGELDWAGCPLSTLPTEALGSLAKKGELNSYAIAATYYYVFNTQGFPFTNINIRRAFSLAIHREAIVQNVTQMGQTPAMAIVPPMLWKHPRSYFKDNDLQEARRLFALGLEELGLKAEEFPAVTLSYNTMIGHHKIAQAIQQQWQEALGIRVTLENKEWKVFLDELRHHKFQIARMGGVANICDPTTFLDFFRYLSSSNNYSQWSHPRFSELLEQADLAKDEETRIPLLEEAESLLMHEMPIAPVYFYTGAYLRKPYVRGIHLSELNSLDLKWAWVELDDD